jgi:hypothetical protein
METKKRVRWLTDEDYDLAVDKTIKIVQKKIDEAGTGGMSAFLIPMTCLMYARELKDVLFVEDFENE